MLQIRPDHSFKKHTWKQGFPSQQIEWDTLIGMQKPPTDFKIPE